MGRILAAVTLLVFLAGCAQKEIIYRDKFVEKKVPIRVACVQQPPPEIDYEFNKIERGNPPPLVMRHLLVSVRQLIAMESSLRGILKKCSKAD
jgi:hypothetical protein